MSQPDRDVDVYRVGVLRALHYDARMLLRLRHKPTALAWNFRYIREKAKARDWRAVARQFDGWHAEHRYAHANAGKGWTRKGALADLDRNLTAAKGPR